MQIIADEIIYVETEIKKLVEKLVDLKKQQVIVCQKCQASTKIGDMVLKVVEYYVEPHGCTEGDYWTEGNKPEFRTECECGDIARHYDYNTSDWRKPLPVNVTKFISDHRRSFKEVEYINKHGDSKY